LPAPTTIRQGCRFARTRSTRRLRRRAEPVAVLQDVEGARPDPELVVEQVRRAGHPDHEQSDADARQEREPRPVTAEPAQPVRAPRRILHRRRRLGLAPACMAATTTNARTKSTIDVQTCMVR
jgi:hypothetical protein